jgi:tetratricopeptide (TPR) repeat protein
MTPTLTHPEAEDLGRFIEGTLDEPARTAVVEHVADCDDCRIIVVDASEFFAKEQPASLAEEQAAAQPSAGGRWWMAAAAAVAIAVGGVWFVDARRDRLEPLKEADTKLPSRLVDGRLNGFGYHPPKKKLRGSGESESTDPGVYEVEAKADEVLERSGNNSTTQHAQGVALLMKVEAQLSEHTESQDSEARQDLVNQRNEAVAKLRAAADGEPDNVAFKSDLATALIATGDAKNIKLAADICSQLVQRNPPPPEALFNQAIAFQLSGRVLDAIAAYQRYSKVDPSSPWANEASDRARSLQEELKPLP